MARTASLTLCRRLACVTHLVMLRAPLCGVRVLQCARTAAWSARAAGVTGHVLMSAATASQAFALTRGYALNPGDRVDTRGGGRVAIELSDGSMVVVQPETILVLKDFQAAGRCANCSRSR